MKLKAYIALHLRQMIHLFNLSHFKIYLKCDKKQKCEMSIVVDYMYEAATLRYGKPIIKAWSENDKTLIIECLAHELLHIPIGEINDMGRKNKRKRLFFEERAVEHCSRLALHLYKNKYKV